MPARWPGRHSGGLSTADRSLPERVQSGGVQPDGIAQIAAAPKQIPPDRGALRRRGGSFPGGAGSGQDKSRRTELGWDARDGLRPKISIQLKVHGHQRRSGERTTVPERDDETEAGAAARRTKDATEIRGRKRLRESRVQTRDRDLLPEFSLQVAPVAPGAAFCHRPHEQTGLRNDVGADGIRVYRLAEILGYYQRAP